MVGLAICLATLVGVIFVLPGPPLPIEPAEDIGDTLRITSKLSYSEAAARRYEPQAFAEEDDVSDTNTHTPSTLFDVCLWTWHLISSQNLTTIHSLLVGM